MAFTILNNLAAGNQPLSIIDTNFTIISTMGQILCTATGTNTIALAPTANMPTQSSYLTGQLYGFLAAATTSGAVTINVGGLGAKNVYRIDSVTQATTGDFVSGVYYLVAYNAALNSAAGGFQIIAPVSSAAVITNSLSVDVNLTNVGQYFDGPSIAQGTTGTWYVSGNVTCIDSAGTANFITKLWDGTTVIDSGQFGGATINVAQSIHLSGFISNPAGNLRISVNDGQSTSGKIKANNTGNGKDSTITAFRIGC